MVLQQTVQHVFVDLHRVLQIQAYIVTSREIFVVLRHHHVLKLTVLLQTAQRVFAVLHCAQQIQGYIVTSRATPVVLFRHALKPMV